jgi:hypothetical protein
MSEDEMETELRISFCPLRVGRVSLIGFAATVSRVANSGAWRGHGAARRVAAPLQKRPS